MTATIQPWLGWALASAVFAALTAIFAKIGVQQIDSNFATFIRVLVLVPVTLGVVAFTAGWTPPAEITPRTWIALVLSALATGASWLCYYRALQLGDAARVAPVDKLSVIMVAIFAVLFLGERLSLRNWLGVAMIAGGVILVAARR